MKRYILHNQRNADEIVQKDDLDADSITMNCMKPSIK